VISSVLVSLLLISAVPQFDITCNPDDFQYMMDNYEDEIIISCSVEHLGVVYDNCTMRVRGDSSRAFRKKSYRVEFPEDQPLDGRTSWNFNADFLDHSYIRSWLFAKVLSEMGFPCFQISHANLSVNGENRGVYLQLEPVNKAFLARNGFNVEGNLYKAKRDGACTNIYDDVDSLWAKTTNESAGMFDLVQLIEDVEYTNYQDFSTFMDSSFVMYGDYGLIRLLAINAAFANNSTYYHNYYLYNDVEGTGLWNMFPWDVDKVFYNNLSIGYGTCTTPNWYDNPLHSRTLVVPEYREAFFDSVSTIYENYLTEEKFNYWADSIQTEIMDAVAADTCDSTDVQGFLEATVLLADTIIFRKNDLAWQFEYRYFPFFSIRSDTITTGDLTIFWHPTEDPFGNQALYSVVVRDSLGPYSQEEIFRVDGLADTTYTITGLPEGQYMWTVETDKQGWRFTEATPRYNPFSVVTPTVLTGTLLENTELHAGNSPYFIQGELYIPDNISLVINSGVTVLMEADASIKCLGSIIATGTETDSVFIQAENSALGWAGIKMQNGLVNLAYVSLTGSRGYSSTFGADFAALASHSSEVLISNSSFRNNYCCVKLIEGNVGISDSRFINNRGELFFMQDGEEAFITNSQFINLYDPVASSMDGIEFHLCTNGSFEVIDCFVENIDGDCIDMNASSVTISGTHVSTSTDKGFSIGAPTGGSGQGTVVTIENSIIENCPYGLGVKDGAAVIIDNTVISNCDTALRTYEKTSGMGGGFASVSNSIFTNCPIPVLEEEGQIAVEWSLSDTEILEGSGNIHGNPNFATDYYLAWNSPCINSGSPDKNDPDGSRIDMGTFFFPTSTSGLVVNELMAINTSTITDDWGRTSDWIEIFNNTGFDFDAGVLVFSEPDSGDIAGVEWSVPRGIMIPKGGFLLFWADSDEWKEGTHLPFRLAGGGDSFSLGRIVPGTSDVPYISRFEWVEFENQMPDISIGRFPDGGVWSSLELPTPGYSNGSFYTTSTILGWPRPNPCSTGLVSVDVAVEGGQTEVFVYDLAGRKVETIINGYLTAGNHVLTLPVDTYSTGIYFIFARCANQKPATVKFTVLPAN